MAAALQGDGQQERGGRTLGEASVVVIGDVLLLSACDGVMVLQQGHHQLQGPAAQRWAADCQLL